MNPGDLFLRLHPVRHEIVRRKKADRQIILPIADRRHRSQRILVAVFQRNAVVCRQAELLDPTLGQRFAQRPAGSYAHLPLADHFANRYGQAGILRQLWQKLHLLGHIAQKLAGMMHQKKLDPEPCIIDMLQQSKQRPFRAAQLHAMRKKQNSLHFLFNHAKQWEPNIR